MEDKYTNTNARTFEEIDLIDFEGNPISVICFIFNVSNSFSFSFKSFLIPVNLLSPPNSSEGKSLIVCIVPFNPSILFVNSLICCF